MRFSTNGGDAFRRTFNASPQIITQKPKRRAHCGLSLHRSQLSKDL
jgi:hypothetical protein